MGLSSKLLPPNILKAMQKETRQEIGAALPDELQARHERKYEKDLQRQIYGWLEIQGVFAGMQRMDKKSNLRLGWPDIVFVWPGENVCVPIAVECKSATGTQNPEQVEAQRRMTLDGWLYWVVRSLPELIARLKK